MHDKIPLNYRCMGSQDELANLSDNHLDDNNSKRVEYLVKKIPGKDVKNVTLYRPHNGN